MSSEERQRSREFGDDKLTSEGNLHVVINKAGIVVTMTSTEFLVAYAKLDRPPWLSVSELRDDANANISQIEFVSCAWSAAIDEAGALGSIVRI
jgi:hypothetical protein